MSTQTQEKESIKRSQTVEDIFLQEAADNLKHFHAPEDSYERVFHGYRLKQDDLIRMGKLVATFRKFVEPDTTQANIIEVALCLLEKKLISQGLEIQPISKKMLATFLNRSKKIKAGHLKNKTARDEKKAEKKRLEEEQKQEFLKNKEAEGNGIDRFIKNL